MRLNNPQCSRLAAIKNAPATIKIVGLVHADIAVVKSVTPKKIHNPGNRIATMKSGISSIALNAKQNTVMAKNNLT